MDEGIECTHAQDAEKFQWIFTGFWGIVCFITVPVCMMAVYCAVRDVERNVRRHSFYAVLAATRIHAMITNVMSRVRNSANPEQAHDNNEEAGVTHVARQGRTRMRQTKYIAEQCFLYSISFYITIGPAMTLRMVQATTGTTPFW
eukprot:CAMPEP_0172522510 /NCGR_PEP_ID=MMETSP1066-20121228/293167_1 /TAXON_ID=671091 /ORGANISM="Coscinodiscus wailesii, Strain CCMP2513" /LENGTH=144 /DNA_ID=CAMNT_0013305525 /DNA_START=658 /DNA_END=1089 /DNA_ORIENTATION=+